MSLLGDLERIAADLYPYRWPITIGALVLLAGLLALAYRQGWYRVAMRHKLATSLVVVPLLAIAIPMGWYTLSPLWERSHLEEASPLAAASPPGTPATEPAPVDKLPPTPGATAEIPASAPPATDAPTEPAAFEPQVVQSGTFQGADDFHFGRGDALLIETEPGRYVLRFEEFSVRNGPDLFVYLSPNADGYADGALNLGELKATDGAFNYDVPPGTEISQFKSAIVWCRDFSVLFAVAPLA